MQIEPYSSKSICEDGCDVVARYLTEDRIIEIDTLDWGSCSEIAYAENGEYCEGETMVATWSNFTSALIHNDLITWEELKKFYAENQALINKTFLPWGDFRQLSEYMQQTYSTESQIVAVAAYAIYHWCFGFCYRAKRLAAEAEREKENAKKQAVFHVPIALDEEQNNSLVNSRKHLLAPNPVYCLKCGAFLGMSDPGVLISACCGVCEQQPHTRPASIPTCVTKVIRTFTGIAILIRRIRRIFLRRGN